MYCYIPQATQFKKHRASVFFLIRCCSRWGLHSLVCHHTSGELLPHLFTLTLKRRLFSVALSLRFPLLAVNQHHCSMEPGLSSRNSFRNLPATNQFTLSILYHIIHIFVKVLHLSSLHHFLVLQFLNQNFFSY